MLVLRPCPWVQLITTDGRFRLALNVDGKTITSAPGSPNSVSDWTSGTLLKVLHDALES